MLKEEERGSHTSGKRKKRLGRKDENNPVL
jgi:hypothetical protein